MYESLELLKEEIIGCKKCDLCKTRKNSVPGKGNKNAEVIFVGEAPGRTEDVNGEPFVGSAGKKLTTALENAGLTRDMVYITNIVKCRPPENRKPTEMETNQCQMYLKNEFSLIKPKIVCLLGNTAYKTILGGGEISKNHGKLVQKDGFSYFITFHPAAVIYNQKLVKDFENDIKKIVKLLKEK